MALIISLLSLLVSCFALAYTIYFNSRKLSLGYSSSRLSPHVAQKFLRRLCLADDLSPEQCVGAVWTLVSIWNRGLQTVSEGDFASPPCLSIGLNVRIRAAWLIQDFDSPAIRPLSPAQDAQSVSVEIEYIQPSEIVCVLVLHDHRPVEAIRFRTALRQAGRVRRWPKPPSARAQEVAVMLGGSAYREYAVGFPAARLRDRILAGCTDGVPAFLVGSIGAAVLANSTGLNTRRSLVLSVVMSAIVWFIYRFVVAAVAKETAGARICHLETRTFGGRVPTARQRLVRVFAEILSCTSCGIGLIWALFDEETLSIHDHMSETLLVPEIPQELRREREEGCRCPPD
jgi:hypothetical protein